MKQELLWSRIIININFVGIIRLSVTCMVKLSFLLTRFPTQITSCMNDLIFAFNKRGIHRISHVGRFSLDSSSLGWHGKHYRLAESKMNILLFLAARGKNRLKCVFDDLWLKNSKKYFEFSLFKHF